MSAATEQQRSRKSSIDPAFEPYNVPQTPPPRPLGTRGSAGRLSTIKRLGTSAGPLKGTSGQRSPQPSLKEEPSLVDKSVTGATTPAVPLADEDIVPPLWFKLKTIPPVLIAAVLGGMTH